MCKKRIVHYAIREPASCQLRNNWDFYNAQISETLTVQFLPEAAVRQKAPQTIVKKSRLRTLDYDRSKKTWQNNKDKSASKHGNLSEIRLFIKSIKIQKDQNCFHKKWKRSSFSLKTFFKKRNSLEKFYRKKIPTILVFYFSLHLELSKNFSFPGL